MINKFDSFDTRSLIVDPDEKERNAFAQRFADYFLEESGNVYVEIINFRLLLLASHSITSPGSIQLDFIYPSLIQSLNYETEQGPSIRMLSDVIACADVTKQKSICSLVTMCKPSQLPDDQFPDLLNQVLRTIISKEFGDGFDDWVNGVTEEDKTEHEDMEWFKNLVRNGPYNE